MKIYLSPETKSLKVNGQDLLVSFGVNETSSPSPAPGRSGSIGTVTTRNGYAWY